MKNKPQYAIASVDHALHLAQLLQHEGALRVTDAAELLGVSASTAHRLLSMLVFRDFAEQAADRRYLPGPLLRPTPAGESQMVDLRRAALPHLHVLVEQVQESANLMVLAGSVVQFAATVECAQVLRVGDRSGKVLPAALTSGGKAILARLAPHEVTSLYENDAEIDLVRLRRELGLVRKRGFAINDQRTETGLTAVGLALVDRAGTVVGALSLALPTARFDRDGLPRLVSALAVTAEAIRRDLSSGAG